MTVYSNTSSCEEPNKIAHFNPAPTSLGNKHPNSRESGTGCYWRDGSPADGTSEGASPIPLYPCLNSSQVYSANESIVCCEAGDACLPGNNLCGRVRVLESITQISSLYRGGCTAKEDEWGSAPGCPQKCLSNYRPFDDPLNSPVQIVTCSTTPGSDNYTVFCVNDELDSQNCGKDEGAWPENQKFDEGEVFLMDATVLYTWGIAESAITAIPRSTDSTSTSTTTSSSMSSSTTTSMIMGTPPPNVTAPNSPNPTTIILAVGIPLGLLFFFGIVAVAFVCYRRRNAPEPEPKRRSFTVLNVNHATALPAETNSLGTACSERNVLPGPLSSNPILPLSPSDADLAATTGTSEIPQRPIRTPSPVANNSQPGGAPPISLSHPTPGHNRRSGTPTPWPVSEPFIHAYANQNLNSNRNSHTTLLRRSHTEGDCYLSSPATTDPRNRNRNRNSHQSTCSAVVPFPSYSEPNIGYTLDSGPQFPFYSREVHEKLQQMEYERGLEEYYAAGRGNYRGLAGLSQSHIDSYVEDQEEGGQQECHGQNSHSSLPSQQQHSYRPPSQQFEFDFPLPPPHSSSTFVPQSPPHQVRATSLPVPAGSPGPSTRMYTYGYGRSAEAVGRLQIVQIGPRNGSAGESSWAGTAAGQQQSQQQQSYSRVVRDGVDTGDEAGNDGAGAGAGIGNARGSGSYTPYRSPA